MTNSTYTKFHYKSGDAVSHAEHLKTSMWHRGVSNTKVSRKDFTCVFGCTIPQGSSYVTLEIMAGDGRADSMVDFALCHFHKSKTEGILGSLEHTKIEPSEIFSVWGNLFEAEALNTPKSSLPDMKEPQSPPLPEEIISPERYFEGATKTIHVNVYERNQKARTACIDTHGCACVVCGFDFEVEYGEIGKKFIHVHHLIQLASVNKEYEINPEEDLRPVCPNCHAMLHRRTPAYSIDELRGIRATAKK